jgi:hypothetical protein
VAWKYLGADRENEIPLERVATAPNRFVVFAPATLVDHIAHLSWSTSRLCGKGLDARQKSYLSAVMS